MKMSAAQAAQALGISERTVRRHIAAGKIRARKVAPNRYEVELDDPLCNWNGGLVDLYTRMERLEVAMRRIERLLESGRREIRIG